MGVSESALASVRSDASLRDGRRDAAPAAMWARCVRRGYRGCDAEALASLFAMSAAMARGPVREWPGETLLFGLGLLRLGGSDGLDMTLTADAVRIVAAADGPREGGA